MSLLNIYNLVAGYGDFQALFEVSLSVEEGKIVAIIGSNGAGKTTLLKTITGLLHPQQATDVQFDGNPIGSYEPETIVKLGIAMVPEGRRAFASLNVEDNLRMGGYCGRSGPWTLDRVYALFPNLAERRFAMSPTLSGGQQQRLCIARGLAVEPEVLLLDEPCSALDPISTAKIEELLVQLKDLCTIVIVTHNMQQAARVSDFTAFLLTGQLIEFSPTPQLFTTPGDPRTEAYITGRFG